MTCGMTVAPMIPIASSSASRAAEARHQAAGDAGRVVVADRDEVIEEAERDEAQQPDDRQLEAPVAALLEREDPERDDGRDQPGREQPDAEQQMQPDRGADELREVRRDRDDLRLDPEKDVDRARKALAAQLGEVAPRGEPRLRRQVLHEHRHEVGHDDDPDEQVAELRAGREVRREVAGVDVRDGGHERRAEQREAAADRAPRARPLQRAEVDGHPLERGGRCRRRGGDDGWRLEDGRGHTTELCHN